MLAATMVYIHLKSNAQNPYIPSDVCFSIFGTVDVGRFSIETRCACLWFLIDINMLCNG